jgi:TonB-dependent starch-binding outer membrane protein SusC
MRKSLTCLLGMLCICTYCIAQNYTISGKVTDSKDGGPLPGVTVRLKGSKAGTVTNIDGQFSLLSKSDKPTLEISYIGYMPQTITASANTPVTISLDVETISMSEVVVTGVGVATSKKKVAFAVETITTDKTTPTGNVGQFLVGKVAGAQISSTNGSPG